MKVQEAVQGKHYEFPDGKRGKYLRELKGLYKFQQEDGKLFSKDAADDMVELSAIESLKNESEVSARDALAAEELSLIRPGAVDEVFNPPKQEPPKQEPPKEEPKVEKKKWGKKEKKVDADGPVQASLDDGFVLVVDRPIVGAGTDLAPYVAGLCQKLCEKFNLPDVRLATGDNLLAFGRWKAMLGGLAAENPPKGLCFLMRSELNDPVIEALLPLAKGFVV
ncbi:MAG: hypothetical protein E6R03_17960 [Hyphomicrobiaceae bacterium]|nr:MAG: hypothetical protein E6R03_17960 [Hyphomicrobiaceae bacterium]